jgi:hypothetical protein
MCSSASDRQLNEKWVNGPIERKKTSAAKLKKQKEGSISGGWGRALPRLS